MARKLFDDNLSSPISPLIDVVMNGLAAMFIILMVYIVMARPSDANQVEPLSFISNVDASPVVSGQSYVFSFPVSGGQGKRKFAVTGSLPPDLQFDTDTGTVFGTTKLNTPGSKFNVQVTVQDKTGNASRAAVLEVFPKAAPFPRVAFEIQKTAGDLSAARVGLPYEYVIGIQGGIPPYRWRLIEGKLPKGLEFSEDGRIGGTPGELGVFQFTVSASYGPGSFSYRGNVHSWTAEERSRTYRIIVTDCKNYVLSTPLGRVHQPYTASVHGVCIGTGDEVQWEASVDGLAPTTIGTFEGTPTKSGQFPLRYKVVNGGKEINTGAGQLNILPERPIPNLNSMEISANLGELVREAIPYQGLEEPVSFSTSTSMLTDLGLRIAGNQIEGTPTKAGTFQMSLSAKDAIGKQVSAHMNVKIAAPQELRLAAQPSADIVVGRPVWIQPQVVGASGSYAWELRGNPQGLSVQTNGKIGGIVNAPGKWKLEVKVTDFKTKESASATIYLTSTYAQESPLQILSNSVPVAIVGAPYEFNFATSGAVGEVAYSLKGSLPPGLAFTSNGIAGIPTRRGQNQIQVAVTDKTGRTVGPRIYKVSTEVIDRSTPAIVTLGVPKALSGNQYDFSFSAEGGFGKYEWRFTGNLPPGLHFARNGISGKAPPNTRGRWKFSVTVRDENNQVATANYELRVD